MISVDIPAVGKISLKYLVCDYSGTLSVDGILISKVKDRLNLLAEKLEVHIVTSDTHGKVQDQLGDSGFKLVILKGEYHTLQKTDYIKKLGEEHTVAIGNGNNDTDMLGTARLSIAVCLEEGVSAQAVRNADILVTSPLHAFDLLLKPARLISTLRR